MATLLPSVVRPVRVIRLISEDTIEEAIFSIAQEKLRLEQDLTEAGDEVDENGRRIKTAAKKDVLRYFRALFF
jgi:SNF2 family DNA or RNA helicase